MVTVVDHCHSMTVWPLNMSDIKQTWTQDWLISHTWLNVMYLCATHTNPSWEMRPLLIPIHLCLSCDLLTSCSPKKQICGPTLCFGQWTIIFVSALIVCLSKVLLFPLCFVRTCTVMSHGCFYHQCLSHLEEESISHWVAEAEDEVFLGVFRYGLDNAVLHPQRMFGNTVVVDPRTTVWLVQEESAALKNAEKKDGEKSYFLTGVTWRTVFTFLFYFIETTYQNSTMLQW